MILVAVILPMDGTTEDGTLSVNTYEFDPTRDESAYVATVTVPVPDTAFGIALIHVSGIVYDALVAPVEVVTVLLYEPNDHVTL